MDDGPFHAVTMRGGGIRGTVAVVKWAYFNAAAVNGYVVTRAPGGKSWSVTGNIVDADAYKLAQSPLFFVAPFRRGAWRWQIHKWQTLEGGRFVAELGPMTTEGTDGITRPTS